MYYIPIPATTQIRNSHINRDTCSQCRNYLMCIAHGPQIYLSSKIEKTIGNDYVQNWLELNEPQPLVF